MKTKEKYLRGLKTAKRKLERIYARNQLFESVYRRYGNRRLFEKKEDKRLVINDDEIMDIFSTIPKETIEFLASKRGSGFIDLEDGTTSIETYDDLIQHIKFMIEIIEFDLVGAFADKILRNVDLDDIDVDSKENVKESRANNLRWKNRRNTTYLR